MSKTMSSGDRVDMRVFSLSLLLLAGVVGPLLMFPESSSAMISAAFSFTTGTTPRDNKVLRVLLALR